MSIKPILFNTDMVRAILDGRKTVTRRVVKPQPEVAYVNGEQRDIVNRNQIAFKIMDKSGKDCYTFPPYQPGDILYVRETFVKADDGYHYRANATLDSEQLRREYGYKYKPSIHMPKEAARIWLKVTNVRVERLRNITIEQAQSEGTEYACNEKCRSFKWCDDDIVLKGGCECFSKLWDTTIKKADINRYGWSANPWVWVIEFERCEKPQEV
jgi:hypothetical protein